MDGVHQRQEQICVVVGPLALQDAHQALQSHPGVHTDLRQQTKTLVHLPATEGKLSPKDLDLRLWSCMV